jgi:hypothetical protein
VHSGIDREEAACDGRLAANDVGAANCPEAREQRSSSEVHQPGGSKVANSTAGFGAISTSYEALPWVDCLYRLGPEPPKKLGWPLIPAAPSVQAYAASNYRLQLPITSSFGTAMDCAQREQATRWASCGGGLRRDVSPSSLTRIPVGFQLAIDGPIGQDKARIRKDRSLCTVG